MNVRGYPRAALAVAVSVLVCLGLILWLTCGWGADGAVSVVDSVGLVPFAIYASVCSALAARSAHERSHGAWTTMSVALAALAVSELTGAFCSLVLRDIPNPSPADGIYWAFCVLSVAAILQLPAGLTVRARMRLGLDCLVVAVALLVLLLATGGQSFYHETLREGASGLPRVHVYPALDLFVAAVAVLALAHAGVGQRGPLWLISAAFALRELSDFALGYQGAIGRFDAGYAADIGWAISLVVLGAAALMARRPRPPAQPTDLVPAWASLWLPYLPLLLAGTIGPAAVMTGPLRIGVPVLMTLVFVRQSYAAWESRRLLSAAADQALRDPLTGLANRTLFNDRLAHAMALRRRDDRAVAVVSLDLDDFKLVNDSLGHPAADSVLVGVGERLSRCARPGDTVARLGGDEFALLLEGRVDRSQLIAKSVLEAFEEPFVIDGQEMLLRPSVGMAVTSSAEPDLTPEGLVTRADLAMYAAKRSRSSGVLTFSTDMMLVDPDVMGEAGTGAGSPASNGASQVRLLGELRHAIDRGDLDVVYQPKLELSTGRVVGVEALLRWPHPQLGVLRPDTFISLIRQQGLMRPVTDLVLEKALDDAARWVLLGAGTSVAVNMFAPFLRDMKLPDRLWCALDDRDLPADMLTVEITEDVVLNELGQVMAVLQGLRERGIRVAIDDFGSGYSALSYLRDLRIDEVKLDRHFIASVTSHERAAAIVCAVIDLSHELGITVVAEGVEDAETVIWLREHGCDIGQGYYLGMPVAASTVGDLVVATRAEPASLPHEPA
jgi:diguanylate cyclase (GGDEF)-like protein